MQNTTKKPGQTLIEFTRVNCTVRLARKQSHQQGNNGITESSPPQKGRAALKPTTQAGLKLRKAYVPAV